MPYYVPIEVQVVFFCSSVALVIHQDREMQTTLYSVGSFKLWGALGQLGGGSMKIYNTSHF